MALDEPPLNVCVVYCPRTGEVDEVAVVLPAGACVRDAVDVSGVLQRHAAVDLNQNRVGVWGKLRGLDAPLRDQDRVEIYRLLLIDPKDARRLRQRQQRAG